MKKQLIEARELAFKNADAIAKTVETEKRSMTEDEMTNLRGFHAEIAKLDKEIEVATKQEELRAAAAVPAVHNVPAQTTEERKIVERFSLRQAISNALPGKQPEGMYAEMHQEAIREMNSAGVPATAGGVNIPGMLMRDNEVTTPAKGGYTVETNIEEVVSILRPNIALVEAGATFMRGLQGDVAFPPQDAGAVATWKAEVAAADEGIITFAENKMSPHRLPTYTNYSLQLLAQSTIDIDAFIKNDFQMAIGEAVEKAAYNGDGVTTEPLGILNQPGLAIHSIADPDGGVATWDDVVALETLVAINNADRGSLAYITNSQVRGGLKVNRKDAGSGIMTWGVEQGPGLLNGRPAYVSNNMPSNLTKGGGTNLSAMIYGNWNDLIVGQWGGINIVTDPYTNAITGQVQITINTFWDILLRRLTSFSAFVDAVKSV